MKCVADRRESWCLDLGCQRVKKCTHPIVVADVLSVSSSLEWLEELLVVCGFIWRKWSYSMRKQEKISWVKSALWDDWQMTVGIKSADLEDNFFF